MAESLVEGRDTPAEECMDESLLEWQPMWLVVFTKRAAMDATMLKAVGLDKKAKRLVDVVREDPFGMPPAHERLVGSLSGLYSRRISIQHRFAYTVDAAPLERNGMRYEGIVKVVRMWTRDGRGLSR